MSVNPSRIYLAKLDPPPATVLDFLVERFPQVGRDAWISRMERGLVRTASGRRLTPLSPYAHGLTVTYHRESAEEPRVPFEERIIHRDERILVADKPHFLPVVPGGPYVEESLLARLRRSTGLAELTPVHRLDRDTAGLVLFAVEARHRASHHRLFAEGTILKEYLAVAHAPREPQERRWRIESRIVPGEPWYTMRVVDGEPNARTEVELLEWRDGRGLFLLRPQSGRKHQLRVQMASIGYPIVNDRLYPEVLPSPADEHAHPLQLLAWRLAFSDPEGGGDMVFESGRALEW